MALIIALHLAILILYIQMSLSSPLGGLQALNGLVHNGPQADFQRVCLGCRFIQTSLNYLPTIHCHKDAKLYFSQIKKTCYECVQHLPYNNFTYETLARNNIQPNHDIEICRCIGYRGDQDAFLIVVLGPVYQRFILPCSLMPSQTCLDDSEHVIVCKTAKLQNKINLLQRKVEK